MRCWRRDSKTSTTDRSASPPLPDGGVIYHSVRAVYAEEVVEAEEEGRAVPPDPFDPLQGDAFAAWTAATFAERGFRLPGRLPNPPLRTGPVRRLDRARRLVRRITAPSGGPDPSIRRSSARWPEVDRLGAISTPSQDMLDERGLETEEGLISWGRLGWLDPGDYRLTAEFATAVRPPDLTDHDQALVIELEINGYLLASQTATVSDVEAGSVMIEFTIPRSQSRASLLHGVQVWIRTRSGVDGTLLAVLLQQRDTVTRGMPDPNRWLPIMDAGTAGRRAGIEVDARPDVAGVVVEGPHWRLPPGSYVVRVRARLPEAVGRDGTISESSSPILAVAEIMAGSEVLWKRPLDRSALSEGLVELPLDIVGRHAGADDRLSVRFRVLQPFPVVIEAVDVERLAESSI